MSKQTHTDACIKGNETFYARSGQQAIDKRRKLWHDHMKRKEEAQKMSNENPLDNFYKHTTMLTARSISALYVSMRKRKTSGKDIEREFGLNNQLISRYRRWSKGLPYGGSSISKFIIDNEEEIKAAIKAAPMPTPSEINRLMKLADKSTWNGNNRSHAKRNPAEHISRPDIILSQAQLTQEIPTVDFNIESNPLSKSDVITGVIVGALVGAALAAYLFMSHGVI